MTLAGVRAHPVPALILVVAAASALLLAVPGQTVPTVYATALLISPAGPPRTPPGRVPTRVSHPAPGPLVYSLPGAGYRLSRTFGGAMPAAMALALAAL